MVCNLKAIGLVLFSILAMSCVVASSASALGEITSTSYPKHLTGEDVGAEDTLRLGENIVSCQGESYTGQLEKASTTIELTITFGNTCITVPFAHWNVTKTGNQCKIHIVWDSNVTPDHDRFRIKITCGVGKAIEIHHYSGSTPHGSSVCTNTIGPQTATGTLTGTSLTASGDILLGGTVGLTQQTHGACSFGFTLNQAAEFITSTTLSDTAGASVHIG